MSRRTSHPQPRTTRFNDQETLASGDRYVTAPGPSNGYHSDSIAIDIPERQYVHSDGETSPNFNATTLNHDDSQVGLPSQQINNLTYEPKNPDIRNRRQSAKKSRMQSKKSRARRPRHHYNEWREDPDGLTDEILNTWRTEDDVDQAPEEEDLSTAKHRDELRDMAISLSHKKRILTRSRAETMKREATMRKASKLSCWTSMKFSWSIRRMHMKKSLENSFRTIGLWQSHLKLVNSHFGTDVTAYFLFLRWLFVANSIIGLIVLLFMFVPQMLSSYVLLASPSNQTVAGGSSAPAPSSGAEALIGGTDKSGSGFWNYIGMFYNNYADQKLNSTQSGKTYEYDMKLAYFLTICAYFLLYFLVIAISAAKSYRENFIESSGKFTFQYVLKIIDGWNYNLDDTKAATLKKKNLYHELKEFCAGERLANRTKHTFCDSVMFTSTRIAAVIIQLLVIAGAGAGVLYTTIDVQKNDSRHAEFIKELIAPLTITIINNILPFLFSVMAKNLRFQNPKSAVYMSLTMTMFLYAVTLLMYFGITMFVCQTKLLNTTDSTEVQSTIIEEYKFTCPTCWEEKLGWRAYSLVIIDLVFGIVITLFSEVFYRLCTQFCCKSLRHPQFDIARNTMSIIYNQFILWLGIYFGPLLTVIVVIKLLAIFYIKRFSVVKSCVPTTKPWRAAKMHTIFLVLLFIGFIGCAVMYGVTITLIKPSTTCGPFTQQNYTYEVIASQISNIHSSKTVLDIVLSPGVVIALIVVLCVVVHYVRVVASGKKKLIALLRVQITLEAKDKVYLRHMLDKVQKRKPSRYNTIEPPPQTQCLCVGECTCRAEVIIEQPGSLRGSDNIELRPAAAVRRLFAKERSMASLNEFKSDSSRSNRNVVTKSNHSLVAQPPTKSQTSMQESTRSLNNPSIGNTVLEDASICTPSQSRYTTDFADSASSVQRRRDVHLGERSRSTDDMTYAHDNRSFQK